MKNFIKKPTKKKKPISALDFEKLLLGVTSNGQLDSLSFADLRFAAQISIIFCTFARYKETSRLKFHHVILESEYILINFPKGKNYQVGEARSGVIVNKLNLKLEPSFVIKFYLEKLSSFGDSSQI